MTTRSLSPSLPSHAARSIERRPLRLRTWVGIRAAARWMAARGISPNAISMAGLVVGVLGGVALAATSAVENPWAVRGLWLAGALMIAARGAANILDGMVAVDAGRCSPTGALWNEVPDRISDVATLVGAGMAVGGHPALGLIAALMAVLVAYVRAAAKVAGAPQDYCGPMAKPARMAAVVLVALVAALTPAAWQGPWPIGGPGSFGPMALALVVIIAGSTLTVARRLARAARALREEPA